MFRLRPLRRQSGDLPSEFGLKTNIRAIRRTEAPGTNRGTGGTPQSHEDRMIGEPTPVGLGMRALKGGAAIVAVAVEHREPRVVLSRFLATSSEGDRLSLEPYAVAAELHQETKSDVSMEATAAVLEGRRRQDALAATGLHVIVRALEEAGCKPIVAALLVNRAGWITDLLEYSLLWPDHIPVAELLAVRDALRFALAECGIEVVELDEKSLPTLSARALDLSPMSIDAHLRVLGSTAGRPWRKEQKLACLSGWFVMAERT